MTKQVFKPLALAAAVSAASLSYNAVAQPVPVPNVYELGDLALVPYYTVRGDWVTGIHIVNTSDHTQVVKFRFRRATDSMDALDFNIVMSPHDVYAGRLERDKQSGTISWYSTDTTCTVPPAQANRLTMQPVYRPGADSGYVEIIAMGEPSDENEPIAVAAKHVRQSDNTFKPRNCEAVQSNFYADGQARVTSAAGVITTPGRQGVGGNWWTYQPGIASSSNPTIRTGGNNRYRDSGNVLKVSYFVRDNGSGIEFGDNAAHISNFLTMASITNQERGLITGDLNGFDFPDLDGTGLPRFGAASTIQRGRFNLMRNRSILGVTSIINEWSTNPANGVEMDWVVTLPGQYTMLKLPQYRASLGSDGAWVPTVSSAGSPVQNPGCPRRPIPANPVTGAAAVPACDYRDQPLELEYTAYNREEFKGDAATGTLVVSPQPPSVIATTYLPKEVNVITFGGKSVLGVSDANVTADLGQPFGWVKAQLKQRSGNDPRVCEWDRTQDAVFRPSASQPPLTMNCVAVTSGTGVPVIGFAAWSRKVARNPNASYGRIVEHSYER